MQTLKLEEVKKAAREYYDNGWLGAQQSSADLCLYAYGDGITRCAIGAALSDETIEVILTKRLNTKSLNDLVKFDNILVVDPLELHAMVTIQSLHDTWVSHKDTEDHEMREREFRLAIDLPPLD